jgi:hypothetical protein
MMLLENIIQRLLETSTLNGIYKGRQKGEKRFHPRGFACALPVGEASTMNPPAPKIGEPVEVTITDDHLKKMRWLEMRFKEQRNAARARKGLSEAWIDDPEDPAKKRRDDVFKHMFGQEREEPAKPKTKHVSNDAWGHIYVDDEPIGYIDVDDVESPDGGAILGHAVKYVIETPPKGGWKVAMFKGPKTYWIDEKNNWEVDNLHHFDYYSGWLESYEEVESKAYELLIMLGVSKHRVRLR